MTSEKRQEILSQCQTHSERKRTAELIRPILRGRDIKQYGYDWNDLWLINIHNGVKGKVKKIDIDEYPSIKSHLDQFIEKITKRSDKGDTPYNLRNCVYLDNFDQPKVIYPNMTKFLPFVYDENKYYVNQKCFFITSETPAYLTAFFNSSLFKFCFRENFPELQGGTRELSKIFFDKIPVLPVSLEKEKEFLNMVRKTQASPTKENLLSLDAAIFDIYRLTAEEREIIGYIEIQ